jgi:hypothetical protein
MTRSGPAVSSGIRQPAAVVIGNLRGSATKRQRALASVLWHYPEYTLRPDGGGRH